MSEGMMAVGAARLSTQAGPVGTGGAAGGAVGGGPAGGGGEAEVNPTNGGMVPNAEGTMLGNPATNAAFAERMASASGQPVPKGPKPILGATSPTGSEPAPLRYIGNPGPNDRKYAIGQDEFGPVIQYIPDPAPPADRSPSLGAGA
jgi:hypothetical protein